MRAPRPLVVIVTAVLLALPVAAKDLRINLPKRSKPTPVQKLNRDGVKAVEKRNYERAKQLFYKAYLLDPNDPFTLNNLGYMAELEGDVERAQRYYALAAEMESDALVDRSNVEGLEGKPVAGIAGRTEDKTLQLNRMNVAAMGLLQKDRAPEADLLLNRALGMDPGNPFTLNNLGYAKEKQGELEQALSFYTRAANAHSDEPIVVAVNRSWRGKEISKVAADNARKIRRLLRDEQDPEAKVARLNLRGVSALNRNQRAEARKYFEEANRLDPKNAFTLNNMGYISELDGDRETAEFYYDKARAAERADTTVGVATRADAEGQPLEKVALDNNQQVNASIQRQLEEKRRSNQPVRLYRRDRTPVVEPEKPLPPPPEQSSTGPATAQPATNGPAEILPPADGSPVPADPRQQQPQQNTTPEQPPKTDQPMEVIPPADGSAVPPDPRDQQTPQAPPNQAPQQQTPPAEPPR